MAIFNSYVKLPEGKPINYLVRGIPTPLKNMSWSVGMMTFPIYGKIKNNPNHQPAIDIYLPIIYQKP